MNYLNLFFIFLVFYLFGCASKNIHSNLKSDPKVLVRQWTRVGNKDLNSAGVRRQEYSSPVIFENTIIFANTHNGLMSIYPKLNRVRWKFHIREGVYSRIAVGNKRVYFGANDGYFYCIDAVRGILKWKKNLKNTVFSKPLVRKDKVFVTTADDTFYALNPNNGNTLWSYKRGTSFSSTIIGASQATLIGSQVIFGLSDGFLISLNVNDGSLNWEKQLGKGSSFKDIDSKLVMEDSYVYISAYDSATFALKFPEMKELWRYNTGSNKQVVIEGDIIYLPTSSSKVVALDKKTGFEKWNFELDGGVPTDIALTEDYVIFGSTYRYLYVLNKKNGKPLYRYDIGYDSGFSSKPIYYKELRSMYILSGSGNLYAFKVFRKNRYKNISPYKYKISFFN